MTLLKQPPNFVLVNIESNNHPGIALETHIAEGAELRIACIPGGIVATLDGRVEYVTFDTDQPTAVGPVELFDEPKIISRGDPAMKMLGPSQREAELMPRSEWNRRRAPFPPHIIMTGHGAQVNIAADHSIQHVNVESDNAAVFRLLEEIKTVIARHVVSPQESQDASLDVQQITTELQRLKPNGSFIWKLVERLNNMAVLAEHVAKLMPLLQHLGLHKG